MKELIKLQKELLRLQMQKIKMEINPMIKVKSRDENKIPCMFDGLEPGVYGISCPCPKCSPTC